MAQINAMMMIADVLRAANKISIITGIGLDVAPTAASPIIAFASAINVKTTARHTELAKPAPCATIPTL